MFRGIFILITAFIGVCRGDCDEKCNTPITHYKEMGCKAIYSGADKCCPQYFDCSVVQGRSNDKCYYNGVAYNLRDQVDNKLTGPNCLASCFCSVNSNFVCAHIDCPEFFNRPLLGPGCYMAYSLDHCCSVGTNCPPFDKLAKCEINGKTYYEGQRFDAPGIKNLNCICQKNFEGKFEAPFCKPLSCGIEIVHGRDFKNNCAPVYYGKDGICPIQWQCNENVVSIQISPDNKGNDKKCKFNDKDLNVGDKVLLSKPYTHSPEINCECIIPPLVTCIQKPHDI